MQANPIEVIHQLEQTRDETLDYFDLPLEELEKRYAPGKWTVRYLLHHLADAETVLFERIRRVISRPGQVIWAFDQDAWAEHLHYQERPLVLSKQLYTATRAGIIYYAGKCYQNNGHAEFVHSETGIRTLSEEIEKVIWHNQQHLNQIKEAVS